METIAAVDGSSSVDEPHARNAAVDGSPSVDRPHAAAPRSTKSRRNEIVRWRLIRRALRLESDAEGETSPPLDDTERWLEASRAAVRAITDEDRLLDALRYMRDARYSTSYMFNVWKTLISLNPRATRQRFFDATRDLVDSDGGARRRSLKSDGRLAFTEREFTTLLTAALHLLRAEIARADSNRGGVFLRRCVDGDASHVRRDDHRLFLYVFLMLAVTGKRLSDIADLSVSQLRGLRERSVCVMTVRKTGALGRIEIPELLSPVVATVRRTDDIASSLPPHHDSAAAATILSRDEIARYIDRFLRWCDIGTLKLPFDRLRKRRALDREFRALYEVACERDKSRGLSFHAMRRAYAGYRFMHGVTVDRLRENLDHSSRRQTNRYVNVCLRELLRDDEGDDDRRSRSVRRSVYLR